MLCIATWLNPCPSFLQTPVDTDADTEAEADDVKKAAPVDKARKGVLGPSPQFECMIYC